MIIEGYFEFSIAGWLQVRKSLDTKSGEVGATIIGYVGITLVFLVPLIIFLLLFISIESLKRDTYMNIIGILYEEVKMHNKF